MAETYPPAARAAASWSEDVQLFDAEWIPSSSDGSEASVSYTFVSPSKSAYYLVFVTASGLRTKEGDWPEGRPFGDPIDVAGLRLESQRALNRAVELGGDGFAQRNGTYGDFVFLRLTRLEEYSSSGPVVWLAGFNNTAPPAQLYLTIDDLTGALLSVKAYGEGEQSVWLHELAQEQRLGVGDSADFFDYLTLTVDGIGAQVTPYSADITIESSKAPFLLRGTISYPDVESEAPFYFGDYVVQLRDIEEDWVDVEVMPLTRWVVTPVP